MLRVIARSIIVFIGVVLQFGFLICIQLFFRQQSVIIGFIYELLSIIIILRFLKDSTRLSNDLPWFILILLFPIFGTILLITLGRSYAKNKLLKSIFKKESEYQEYLVQDEEIRSEIEDKRLDNLVYIMNRAKYPVTKNNRVVYYDFGEKFYPELLKELAAAEKFIFMEYFIIDKGHMWNGILEILKDKAAEGVDVRILYDDIGSMANSPTKFPRELGNYNIKCIPFNKLSPFRGVFMNNRDHRKMTIIDGRVAFSGGVNIGDEYININSKRGIWKDNGIKIEGDAIWNLTVMFLTMWNANVSEDDDISKFKYEFKNKFADEGFVAPYGVMPLHEDLIGEDVYINIINSAKEYVYIMTPYLIIDTDMTNALIRAAKRGVDVRIIVPGVPDKKIVYTQTTSFFEILYNGGVKIYKFSEGFVHSKVYVSDDLRAVVGTINMDYRSLYLHFENGIYMEGTPAVESVKSDVLETLKQCKELNAKDVKGNVFKRMWQAVLRLFAPLF